MVKETVEKAIAKMIEGERASVYSAMQISKKLSTFIYYSEIHW